MALVKRIATFKDLSISNNISRRDLDGLVASFEWTRLDITQT